MMEAYKNTKSLWWLIHKDLTRELRAQHVWPGMVLLGLVLVFLLATQLELPMEEKARVAGGLVDQSSTQPGGPLGATSGRQGFWARLY